MRESDCSLNASDILIASDVNGTQRKSILGKLRRRGHAAPPTRPLWVPFEDGVLLCRAVGLVEELKPLLLRAGLVFPSPEDNYFLRRYPAKRRVQSAPKRPPTGPPEGYGLISWADRKIAYKPLDHTVNATQLCGSGGVSRSMLSTYFKSNRDIAREMVVGNTLVQGTYISYADATVLCQHFNLSCEPVERLMRLVPAAPDSAPDDAANF
jgi:hypothetical protein